MNSPNSNELIYQLETVLDNYHPAYWDDIVELLNKIGIYSGITKFR